MDFLLQNKYSIISIVFILVGLLALYKKGKQDHVRKIALSLVVQAEKNLGSGTGELKYAEVVEGLYRVLPTIIRVLYTKKDIDRIIEGAVDSMKRYLEDGISLEGM